MKMKRNKPIPPYVKYLKNIYVITGTFFIVWVSFFDNNNLLSINRLKEREKGLQEQKVYYEEEIKALEKNMKELSSDPDKLEKFAREKYLFKRSGEDVYIVKDADEQE
ncbi:septum formation initiator family protein [Limibacter armeniacum]|uniref:FtsB family cell division protein n=1 Tax=Limibacter armeniacum TaxID=466084 RepID=UPI002FE56598